MAALSLSDPATVTGMEKPVQWMTLPELRDELERTRPAWETTNLDDFLAQGQLPALSQDAPVTIQIPPLNKTTRLGTSISTPTELPTGGSTSVGVLTAHSVVNTATGPLPLLDVPGLSSSGQPA
jgi:hypothetical protein